MMNDKFVITDNINCILSSMELNVLFVISAHSQFH